MSDEDEFDATPSAADPVARARKENAVELERRETEEFWKAVFASPVGRREVWQLLQSCHTFEERFACGPNGFPQPEATWFHAGEQSFGLRLYQKLMRLDRAGLGIMHDEYDSAFIKPPLRKKAK